MKITLLTIAAVLTGLTSAQNGLPPCAQSCVLKYTTGGEIAGCPSLQIACICSNSNFLSSIACCLVGVCDTADQEAATTYAQNLCKSSGVTNLPSAVSCASTATSSATGMPSSSSGTSASVSTSTTSSESSVSSMSSSMSSSSSVVSVTSQTSSTSATSSSASASATKNAGPQNVAGLGAGILGGMAAVAALL